MQYSLQKPNPHQPNETSLVLTGSWRLINDKLSTDLSIEQILQDPALQQITKLTVDASKVDEWDTLFVTLIYKLILNCQAQNINLVLLNIPEGAQKILKLTLSVSTVHGTVAYPPEDFITKLGQYAVSVVTESYQIVRFIGETAVSFVNFIKLKAIYRKHDLFLTIQQSGAQALPIVTLISILIGLILAFVGNTQLAKFGAEIYVANLVGLGMTREMGAMMTAVIMAGHSGAAFAAQIGTMKVNQEVDALSTFGFSINEFLVLPRVIALVLMVPLLAIYADLLGIIGGALVCNFYLGIKFLQYFQQIKFAVTIGDVMAGLYKSFVFGVLVAIAGCLRGIECGRDASAVGRASTYAVVTSLVLIIVADSILTVLYDILGV